MRPKDYKERQLEVEGWPVKVTSYKLGDTFHCTVDNVSPGAWLARASGSTREEAEKQALAKAGARLGRTRRQQV